MRAGGKEEGLGGVLIADAPDERSTPGLIERQNAKKVREAARYTVWAVVFLCVNVTKPAGGGDEHVFASLDVDASVDPGLLAGHLDFLGEALLALRRLCGRGILRAWLGRDLLRRRPILADELRAQGLRESCGEEGISENKRRFHDESSDHKSGHPVQGR